MRQPPVLQNLYPAGAYPDGWKRKWLWLTLFTLLSRSRRTGAPAPAGPVEWIVAGLGNPGAKYENTRHNVGFLTLDRMAGKLGFRIDRLRFQSLTGEAMIEGRRCSSSPPPS